jgi:hypothetical protein
MDRGDPSLIFLSLVLPCLFAMTLMAEGIWKISQHLSGWINIVLGVTVLGISVWMYFNLLGLLSSL